jgi:hypothetical protein
MMGLPWHWLFEKTSNYHPGSLQFNVHMQQYRVHYKPRKAKQEYSSGGIMAGQEKFAYR